MEGATLGLNTEESKGGQETLKLETIEGDGDRHSSMSNRKSSKVINNITNQYVLGGGGTESNS